MAADARGFTPIRTTQEELQNDKNRLFYPRLSACICGYNGSSYADAAPLVSDFATFNAAS
jgi:hypothetical protein